MKSREEAIQDVHDAYVQANNSDPFAGYRFATQLRNGIIGDNESMRAIRDESLTTIKIRRQTIMRDFRKAQKDGKFVLLGQEVV